MLSARRAQVPVAILVAAALLLGCASVRGAQAYREGNRELERGDPSQAIAQLERAAQLLPEQSEIHNHLGLALARAGRLDEALREFERATELDCDNRAAGLNLAWATQQRSRLSAGSAHESQGLDP